MNTKIGYISMFVIGAASGSFSTWYFLKTKYEKIAQDEIDSVKSAFIKQKSNNLDCDRNEVAEKIKEAEKIMENNNYTSNSENDSNEEEEGDYMEKPYIISPEEYDEMDEYETVSLTYYADDVLADSITDEIVEDREDIVGKFESHFGEYEDDSVFVRNDKYRCDYEILKDERNYADVTSKKWVNVSSEYKDCD